MKRGKMKITRFCNLVQEYNAIFQEEPEQGGFSVWVPDLPGCASQGDTFEEAKKNIIKAIELYLEDAPKKELNNINSRRQFMAPVKVSLYA